MIYDWLYIHLQMSLFRTFQHVLNTPKDQQYDEIRRLAKYVIRQFVEAADKNPKIYAELLFFKNIREANDIESGYTDSQNDVGYDAIIVINNLSYIKHNLNEILISATKKLAGPRSKRTNCDNFIKRIKRIHQQNKVSTNINWIWFHNSLLTQKYRWIGYNNFTRQVELRKEFKSVQEIYSNFDHSKQKTFFKIHWKQQKLQWKLMRKIRKGFSYLESLLFFWYV